jgi:endonuclease/exonuclease/phosphatase family metal-dependent hydrolase
MTYHERTGPRYAGMPAIERIAAAVGGDTLRVVSFNIAFSRRIDSALAVLTESEQLQEADVVLLQEMDVEGTRRIAGALGMQWVYYPSFVHFRTRRDFGNAVLSRWPIVEDSKIPLPHKSRYARTYRAATAATIQVNDLPVRVYSAHLSTMTEIAPSQRREQLRAILEDAALHPRVVIGGDLNSGTVARVALEAGYVWPTERGPRTTLIGRWDHVLFRGLHAATEHTGTVMDLRGASDHRPVWAVGVVLPVDRARAIAGEPVVGASSPDDR